jgi:serine/threonine protein kinase
MLFILAMLFILIILLLFFNSSIGNKIKIGGCEKLNEIPGLADSIETKLNYMGNIDIESGGTSSSVYKHEFEDKCYAIKKNKFYSKINNIRQEIIILNKICPHDNIITYYGSIDLFRGTTNRIIAIVLEWSNIDLFSYIDKYYKKITKNIILAIIKQIFNALNYLHHMQII